MPTIISFGWTSDAFLAGYKDTTRRDWTRPYGDRFKAGDVLDAWDALPRVVSKNPKRIGRIQLTAIDFTAALPAADWHREGFDWLQSHGYRLNGHTPREQWDAWRTDGPPIYVLRFVIVSLTPAGMARRAELQRERAPTREPDLLARFRLAQQTDHAFVANPRDNQCEACAQGEEHPRHRREI